MYIVLLAALDKYCVALLYCTVFFKEMHCTDSIYRGADKSLARPTSRCILFDGENISFDASLVLYIYIYIYNKTTVTGTIL